MNLRADDHPDPCAELERLLGIYDLLFGRPETTVELDEDGRRWLRALLIRQDYASSLPGGEWDPDTEAAVWALFGTENLEERWVPGEGSTRWRWSTCGNGSGSEGSTQPSAVSSQERGLLLTAES